MHKYRNVLNYKATVELSLQLKAQTM